MKSIVSKEMNRVLKFPLEALIWIAALVALALYVPNAENHFTICPFHYLGFEHCLGCGLGRSISYFFHGDLLKSFETHPLGIVAVIILSFRIVELTSKHLKHYGQDH